jgi:membrane fusion protein (multidrug efflux system)
MNWLKRNSVVLVVALAACSGGKKPAVPLPTPEVAVVTVAPQPLVLTTELPGRTAPFLIAEIRPQVNGLIQKRRFTEGADVRAGDLLYQIDPAPFQAAYEKTQALVTTLRLRADRLKEALGAKAVSQQDVDDATAALKVAEAELELARIHLGYTKIVAPIAGRIGVSTVTEGAIVTAYQPAALATIQQLDPVYVDVPQSTADLLRWQRRQLTQSGNKSVELRLEDGTKYPEPGTLQFRDVSVDPTTATVTLRMIFPNPNGVLLPGMFVRTVVQEGLNDQAILVPQQSVARDPKGNPTVLVVNAAGLVELRMLKIDRAVGDKWLVNSGLAAGERVIVEGLQRVRPGSAVKVAQ